MATTLPRTKFGSNQFTAPLPNGVLFFSYETAVAAVIGSQLFRTSTRHSVTTSKHINGFLAGFSGTAELKPQEWFDALAMGQNPDAQ